MINRRRRAQIKKVLDWVGTSIALIALSLGLFGSIAGAANDLDQAITYTGRVEDSRVLSPKGKSNFFLKLDGLDTRLRCYRASGNYSDIIDNVQVGDIVTVYYSNHQDTSLEVYQIEKNGRVILNHSEFRTKWVVCSIIIFVGIIWIVASSYIKQSVLRWIKVFLTKLSS
ncbi:hypothetical protein [Desertivirga xinjiangensis]|uniref:hypothetical protein n=1 Tax=Desertivirga xinjiangensis TaxID=539206 RepID=UPI00210F1B2A|nr:hypothetical protein [Pedobacter xinjiangensis]